MVSLRYTYVGIHICAYMIWDNYSRRVTHMLHTYRPLLQYSDLSSLLGNCWKGYIFSRCFLFSPLGKLADRVIYFTFRNFFLFLTWAKVTQDLLDRFSRFFHQMEGIYVIVVNPGQFLFLKGRCHGNQFCGKINYPLFCHSETECDIATSVSALTA